MGIIQISKLQNQFVKDIATQCDVVQRDGKLQDEEISLFKERAKQAVDCNLLDKKALNNDLMQILGMDLSHEKAENAKQTGQNVHEMLHGYTNNEEQYTVTQLISNMDAARTNDFLEGYTEREYVHFGTNALRICKQLGTEWFYPDKIKTLKTLCNKFLEETKLYGDTNSQDYKTLQDIVKSQDIVKFAKSGVIDKCISSLSKTFKVDDNTDSLINKIQNK